MTKDMKQYMKGDEIVKNPVSKRMICGVVVDDTELHKQIEYWKSKYEEILAQNQRLIHMAESIVVESKL